MLANLGLLALAIFIYNIPSLIAVARLHNNAQKIILINIVFGWTGIGWVIALYWSLQNPRAEYSMWPYK